MQSVAWSGRLQLFARLSVPTPLTFRAILTGSGYDSELAQASNIDYKLMDLNIDKHCNGETGFLKFTFYLQRAEFIEQEMEQLSEVSKEWSTDFNSGF